MGSASNDCPTLPPRPPSPEGLGASPRELSNPVDAPADRPPRVPNSTGRPRRVPFVSRGLPNPCGPGISRYRKLPRSRRGRVTCPQLAAVAELTASPPTAPPPRPAHVPVTRIDLLGRPQRRALRPVRLANCPGWRPTDRFSSSRRAPRVIPGLGNALRYETGVLAAFCGSCSATATKRSRRSSTLTRRWRSLEDAASAANGVRLGFQLAAEEIAGGHAFTKHASEFAALGITTPENSHCTSLLRRASLMVAVQNDKVSVTLELTQSQVGLLLNALNHRGT